MKYNYESLNEAIYKVIPEFKFKSDNGLIGNQPMMLKCVAEKHFLTSAWENTKDFDLNKSYSICQEALKDLSEKGQFVFTD